MKKDNIGLTIFSIILFFHVILVTFGLPVIFEMIFQLVLCVLCIFILYKGKIKIPKELFLWILPPSVICFNVSNWQDTEMLRYLLWFLIDILTVIVVFQLDKGSKNAYKVIFTISIIVFISLCVQIMMPNIFTSVIEPFMVASDTFYYQTSVRNGIKFGIASDKGSSDLIGMLTVIIVFFAARELQLKNTYRFILIGLSFVLCAMAGSRTSLVLIPFTIYVVHLLSVADKKKIVSFFKGIGLFVIGIICVCIIWKLFPNILVVSRIFETISGIMNNRDLNLVSSGRVGLFKAALTGIQESPILGHGWLQYNMDNVGIIDEGTESYVHNIILQLWYDTGFFGMLIFLTPFIYYLVKTMRLMRTYSVYKKNGFEVSELLISCFLQINLLINSLLHVGILNVLLLLVYFFAIALYYVAKRKYGNPEKYKSSKFVYILDDYG